MNRFQLIGKLTSRPKLKRTKQGNEIAKFIVAIERGKTKDGGNAGFDFLPCCAFSEVAVDCYNDLSEDDIVGISGHIHTSMFTSNGVDNFYFEVVVDSIEYLETKKELPKNILDKQKSDKAETFFEKTSSGLFG